MEQEARHPSHKKRSGRRTGPTSSHDLILETARSAFSKRGFEGTTMRAVADAANVDSALIHHFFLSKEGLFMAAAHDAFTVQDLLPTVVSGDMEHVGERLARAFITHWEDPEIQPRLESLIRSARSFEGATAALLDFLGAEILLPVAAAVGHGRPELRASLVGTQLLGVAYARWVLRLEPLASLSAEELVACVADTCQSYLTDRL
ncbi:MULTISPECIES: TetR/AcrR family transcriptional regulator [unclassified Streptomyces]|uniref:TetR/AcrR family transcriptional regulator n=1 Tax=unclassified Streptomyces TaxID=2593676 RepID=UPI00224DAEDF|nr:MULTISPECIES: TetR family transcriptional regulator [unclassified Streptomyces]WSP53047.1 TetR family transcriptional regulator [Streptomyces sp. NBC_01241]WSU19644.1 TetR family transcriptional regulator [Streptomyces sp. NBC_01108]MCX4800057.1 TetR family transcriptional regulator [Streptomyces sp. NBC_01242]WSJ40755.1 TetR family transcriptional regulator [Streptomyces sp. NBC_01321]WSP59804.1 TetR family transcriptional regulator [Streptomyces sp. NBC_01241]